MAHAQKPEFIFRWNGQVHLNRRGRQFSRLLAAEVYASAVVMLDTPCSEVVWRVLATHFLYSAFRKRLTVEASWNVMAHTQKPDFVFRRNGRVHLNRQVASVQSTAGSQGVRISGSNARYTVFRGSVKGTGYPLHSPVSLHFPTRASPCDITFQLESTTALLRWTEAWTCAGCACWDLCFSNTFWPQRSQFPGVNTQ